MDVSGETFFSQGKAVAAALLGYDLVAAGFSLRKEVTVAIAFKLRK